MFHKSSWGQEMMYTPQKFSQSHDPLQKFANPSQTLSWIFNLCASLICLNSKRVGVPLSSNLSIITEATFYTSKKGNKKFETVFIRYTTFCKSSFAANEKDWNSFKTFCSCKLRPLTAKLLTEFTIIIF